MPLHLTRTADQGDLVDALATALAADGGGRAGIDAMAADLTRTLRRSRVPHPRLLGLKVREAWTWEAADRRDREWWPQGITTSARTGFAERHGHDVLMTSWYAKGDAGSRLSLVDLERRRYGHVLLVRPTLVDGVAGFLPLKVHAGGVIWQDGRVHVAATRRGFFTFDTADVLRVPVGSAYETFGHRYVLPVRFALRGGSDDDAEHLRFSFMTLDRNGADTTLVVGEYGSPRQSQRIARYPIDPDTGLPRAGADGRAVPELADAGIARMQGVVVVDGRLYLSRSRGPTTYGSVYVGTPGRFHEHRWASPMGPEDLVWWPETGAVWCTSEHPRRRWIYAMDRADLDRTDETFLTRMLSRLRA